MSAETCPACKVSLQGEPIPQESIDKGYFGDKTHFSRLIMVEVQGVYDGGLYYRCPDCDHAWPRWTDGAGRLTALSAQYAAEHNARAGVA